MSEMEAENSEFDIGNLIADSYIYEARRNGIDDIDVALVGLGTIRDSISAGDVCLSDAFRFCSLGVGEDGSAGHPLLTAYITGRELKLLTELDASLGPLVSYIRMSYSGLTYSYNPRRALLDRVEDVRLVKMKSDSSIASPLSGDAELESIEDDKLYKVCCNMYAANMLGMLNGLTKGILSIEPKNADGTPIEDFYDVTMRDKKGEEIKEWVAFKNYLEAYPEGIPEEYNTPQGRKIRNENFLTSWTHPGTSAIIIVAVVLVLQFVLILIIAGIRNKKLFQ